MSWGSSSGIAENILRSKQPDAPPCAMPRLIGLLLAGMTALDGFSRVKRLAKPATRHVNRRTITLCRSASQGRTKL